MFWIEIFDKWMNGSEEEKQWMESESRVDTNTRQLSSTDTIWWMTSSGDMSSTWMSSKRGSKLASLMDIARDVWPQVHSRWPTAQNRKQFKFSRMVGSVFQAPDWSAKRESRETGVDDRWRQTNLFQRQRRFGSREKRKLFPKNIWKMDSILRKVSKVLNKNSRNGLNFGAKSDLNFVFLNSLGN